MGTGNALYFRGELPKGFRPAVEGRTRVRAVAGWTELSLPGVQDGLDAAKALSLQVPGEVIWALVQTTASVVALAHCEAGRVLRHVTFSDGAWSQLDGEPRAWEQALFSPEALARAQDDATPEELAAIEARFAARRLELNAADPMLGEWDTLLAALGLTMAQWREAHAGPAPTELEGARTTGLTWVARGTLAAGLVALMALVVVRTTQGPGDVTGLLGLLMSVLLAFAFGAGGLRRVSVGRWFG
jgi:hypothetical protein